MRRRAAALAAVGAISLLAQQRDVPTTPVPVPAAVFTAASLDDRTVVARLRAIDETYISHTYRIARRSSTPRHRPRVHAVHVRHRSGRLSFTAWLRRAETRKIRRCESDNDYTLVDYNKIPGRGWVAFYGAWQMDADFVATYAGARAVDYVHGGKFTMPKAMQDAAAYAGYVARGDEPWSCR